MYSYLMHSRELNKYCIWVILLHLHSLLSAVLYKHDYGEQGMYKQPVSKSQTIFGHIFISGLLK